VDSENISESVKCSLQRVVSYLFEVTSKIQEKIEDSKIDSDEEKYFETVKSMAKELGNPVDPIRNRNLVNMESLSRRPVGWQSYLENLDTHLAKLETKQSLTETTAPKTPSPAVKGERMFRGHPVRLFENDSSKPYGNGFSGKKLVYVEGVGATFVDSVPEKLKLNFDPEVGVVMTPQSVPTNWKGIRKFTGHHR